MSELCVPGCRYRQLYEGSQTSLADMASNQARSVTEHRQLRTEIARLLKRYFPREFQAAERSLGGQMADVDDDVIVAYLDQLLAARHLDGSLASLRAALVDAGYDVTTDDVAQWATAVRERPAPQASTAAPAAPATPATPAASGPVPAPTPAPPPAPTRDEMPPGLDALDELLRDLGGPGVLVADDDPFAGLDAEVPDGAAVELGAAGGTLPDTGLDGLDLDATVDLDELEELDDLFGDDAAPEPAAGPVAAADPDPVEPAPAPPAAPAADDGLGDLFADGAADGIPDGGDGLDDLFGGDAPLPAPGPAGLDDLFDTSPAQAPVAVPTVPAPTPAVAVPAPEPAHAPAAPAPPAAQEAVADAAPEPPARTMPLPLKPEVVPTRKRSGRRTPRTRAVRGDVPGVEGAAGSLDDRTRKALLASVAIPRPVFVADLATVAGSREMVEDWETEMRDLSTGAPVRFIAGKQRHRKRGSLVIPHGPLRDASKEFATSWWSECLEQETYRGARLYELAVLLHRVGSDVIATDFDADAAVLRVNDQRGLVGIVVVLAQDLTPESSGHERLRSALGALVRERLGLVAVLAINAEAESSITSTVEELARTEGWSPNAPVVYSTTSEWADDAGSTAKLLVGG